MRDAHRMKEKFDLSLDNRQIVSLVIASIVVLGAVFVLGVVVGKKLSTDTQSAAAPDLLTALDRKAEVLEQVQKEAPLTFQDELTRRSAPDAATPTPAPREAVKAEPVKAEPTRLSEPAKVATATPEREEPAAEVAAAEPPAERKPEPTPERKAEPLARTTPAAPVRATTPAPAARSGAFTLQLSAYQTKAEADKFVASLRARGYAPFIVSAAVPGKGTWYRVRMGRFPTKDAATRYLSDFKRETRLPAFVASNEP